jgi:hypothetical protein
VGNAYTCSTTPSFTPVAGDQILVYFNATNTGASTLAVNSAAAAAIYKWGNTSALVSGDIQAAHYIRATWDGTHWQLEGQLGNAIATSTLGVSTNTAAAATYVGQVIQSQVIAGSAVSLTNNTAAVVTSVSLTAGDWDVEASGNFLGTSITTAATGGFELSINSGTGCSTPAQATTGQEVWTLPPALTTTSANFGAAVSQQQALIGSTTTYCLVATGTFSAGTLKADGTLVARRRH